MQEHEQRVHKWNPEAEDGEMRRIITCDCCGKSRDMTLEASAGKAWDTPPGWGFTYLEKKRREHKTRIIVKIVLDLCPRCIRSLHQMNLRYIAKEKLKRQRRKEEAWRKKARHPGKKRHCK